MKHIKRFLFGVGFIIIALMIIALIVILAYLTSGWFIWLMCFGIAAYFIGVLIQDGEDDD